MILHILRLVLLKIFVKKVYSIILNTLLKLISLPNKSLLNTFISVNLKNLLVQYSQFLFGLAEQFQMSHSLPKYL